MVIGRFRVSEVEFGGIVPFRSKQHIVFQDGPVLIDGEIVGGSSITSNGAGKTTFLNAVMLGLVGEIPSGAVRGDGIIFPDEDFAYSRVVLEDMVGDGRVEIGWEKSRGKSTQFSLEIPKHGVFLEDLTCGSEDHRKVLMAHFGITPPMGFETFYSSQGALSNVVDGTDNERKKALMDVLGLSECGSYLESTKVVMHELDRSISRISITLGRDKEDAIRLKKSKGDLKKLGKDKASVEMELQSIRTAIEMVNSAIDRMSENESVFRQIDSERNIVNAMKTSMKMSIEGKNTEIQTLEDIIEDLDRAVQQIPSLKETIDGMISEKNEALEIVRELKGFKSTGGSVVRGIVSKVSRVEAKMDALEERRAKLTIASDTCPICDGPLTRSQKKRLIYDIDLVMFFLKKKHLWLERQHENLMGALEDERRKEDELGKAESKISTIGQSITLSQSQLEEFEERAREKDFKEKRVMAYRIALDQYEEKIKKDIQGGIKRIEKLEKRLEEDESGVNDLRRAKERLDELRDEEAEAIDRNATLAERVDSAERKVSDLGAIKKRIRKLKVSMQRARKFMSALETWRVGFSPSGIPTMVMEGAIPKLNSQLDGLCETMIPGRGVSFTSGRELSDGRISDEIMIGVSQVNGGDIPYALCSGGEKKRIRLAVRLALMRHISMPFSFGMFDEITHELDQVGKEIAVRNVMEVFDGGLVLFTSNDDSVKEMFDNRMTVVKENGESRVVQ